MAILNCSVYRSSKREATYVYLADGTGFEELPAMLRTAFGTPEFVLQFELTKERRLATEDPLEVLDNLARQGFHLQLPPGDGTGDFP